MVTVAVTSSRDRSAGMAAELVAVGLQPVVVPCVRPLAGAPEDIARLRAAGADADLVLLDSTRPLEILWPRVLPPTPFAVSRPAVATAVAARGGTVECIGNGDLFAFARENTDRFSDRTIAFPHAAGVDPRVVTLLAEAAGWLVSAGVYVNRPCRPTDETVAAAVFLTACAVDGWALGRSFTGLVVGARGPGTRSALERYGRTPDVGTRGGLGELAAAVARALA